MLFRRKKTPTVVRFEQAVYGSFPFWDKGYAVLAQSPGVDARALAEFRTACQRFGELPSSMTEVPPALFSLRLSSELYLIVGVGSPGNDDRGRPNALCFHGLFLTKREFRAARFDPFALAGALKRAWTAESTALPSGTWSIPPLKDEDIYKIDHDIDRRYWTSVLIQGRKVATESVSPIDEVAERVWHHLPPHVRKRCSLATLAFGNGNRFDLVAFPKLAAIVLDKAYVNTDPPPKPVSETPPLDTHPHRRRWWIASYVVGIIVLLVVYKLAIATL